LAIAAKGASLGQVCTHNVCLPIIKPPDFVCRYKWLWCECECELSCDDKGHSLLLHPSFGSADRV